MPHPFFTECHCVARGQVWTRQDSKRFPVFNSWAPRIFEMNFRKVIFKLNLVIDGWGISWETVVPWTPQVLTDEKSTLFQVMAWCRQATSHYLGQCWPSFLSPYGVIMPQWVNSSLPGQNGPHFADDVFRCIFLNEKFCILIKMSP